MKRQWLRAAAFVLLAVLLLPRLRANEVLVTFRAVIEQSPFTTPGLEIGSEITGGYYYDPAALPSSFDFKGDTKYDLSRTFLAFPDYGLSASYSGHVHVSQRGFWERYRVNGGMGVSDVRPEGWRASFWALNLDDGDGSYYGTTPLPYPIDLPDLASFAPPVLEVAFEKVPDIAFIVARVSTLEKAVLNPSIDVPDSGSSLVLLSTSFGLMALISIRSAGQSRRASGRKKASG